PWSHRHRICGRLAQQEEMFGKAVALRPEDRGLWLARGRHFARLGQWKKAAAYARATELPSTDKHEHAWFECAAVSVLAGDTEGYATTTRRAPGPDGRTGKHLPSGANLRTSPNVEGGCPARRPARRT